jgi:hypothetical protein
MAANSVMGDPGPEPAPGEAFLIYSFRLSQTHKQHRNRRGEEGKYRSMPDSFEIEGIEVFPKICLYRVTVKKRTV